MLITIRTPAIKSNLADPMRMLAICFVCMIILSCRGESGSAGTGAKPALSYVSITPNKVAAGLTVTFSGNFSFVDIDGDLDGGTFNYTYDGNNYSIPLPIELLGIKNAVVEFQLMANLSAKVGAQDVPCWLTDRAGNSSNVFHVSINQMWTRQFGTVLDDIGSSIGVDGTGNVIVAGTTSGELYGELNLGSNDAFVSKYTSGAERLWTRQVSSGNDDYGKGVAVDNNDFIYVVGDTAGALFDGQVSDPSGDGFITKYSPSGVREWSRLIGLPSSDDGAAAVSTDTNNDIYVAGYTSGSLNGETYTAGRDAFLAKYDANGNTLWTRLIGTTGEDNGYSAVADGNGNVYIAGGTEGVLGIDPSPGDPTVNFDSFVAKYDKNGNRVWITQFGTSCGEWVKGIAVDSSGNVSVVGEIYQCAFADNTSKGGYDAYIARLDINGVIQWIKQFGTVNHDSANGVSVDSSGNAYVTGYLDSYDFNGINEGRVVFLAKYDISGNQLWNRQDSTGASWGNQGVSVAISNTDSLFLVGTLQGQLDGHSNNGGNDTFILKYDTSGVRY